LLNSQILLAQQAGLTNDAGRKRLEIVRTELAPKIDGVLDDEIWKTATLISDFHQFQPVDHGEPVSAVNFTLPIVNVIST